MIEKEISSAFKLKEDYTQMLPSKKEIKKIIRDTVIKRREENSKDSKRIDLPGETLTKKDEIAELDGQKMLENLKKRGVAGGEKLNVI